MDEFHTRLIGSPVAHSRYVAAFFDALSSDTRERLLACSMPIGSHTWLECNLAVQATKHHANLAVRLPHPCPYYAFEWMLFEKCYGRR